MDTDFTPAPAALGISKQEISQAQKLAALPKETFKAVKAGKKKFRSRLTGCSL